MHIPPNWGPFFALIVSFLIFWFIFKRLFFDPFLKVLADRERRLNELGERADRLIKEGKDSEEERNRQLAVVRRDALARRDEQRRQAEAQAAQLIEEAKVQARASMERTRSQIEQQVSAAEKQLETFAHTLGGELAERLLGRPIKDSAATRNN